MLEILESLFLFLGSVEKWVVRKQRYISYYKFMQIVLGNWQELFLIRMIWWVMYAEMCQ